MGKETVHKSEQPDVPSVHKLERPDGPPDVTLIVKKDSTVITFAAPVSEKENVAVDEVGKFNAMLHRPPSVKTVADDGALTLTLPTPKGEPDPGFAVMAVDTLAKNGAIKEGQTNKFRDEVFPVQTHDEIKQKSEAPASGMERAMALMGELKAVLIADAGHTDKATAPLALPAKEVVLDRGSTHLV